MNELFGAAALRHFGFAARLLGWRPAEFWAATPAELVAAVAPAEMSGASFDRTSLNRLMEQDNDIDR